MKHFCSVFVEKKKKEFRVQLFFGGLPYFEFFAGIFFFSDLHAFILYKQYFYKQRQAKKSIKN